MHKALSLPRTPFQLRAAAVLLETIFSTTIIRSVLIVAIHIWTVSLAFKVRGIKAAMVTLHAPFFAELYWFIVLVVERDAWAIYHGTILFLASVMFKLSEQFGGVQINISKELLE